MSKAKANTNQKKIKLSEKDSLMQSVYIERLERFLALAELSYALKTAPRIFENQDVKLKPEE
jgi:hypothetical protein